MCRVTPSRALAVANASGLSRLIATCAVNICPPRYHADACGTAHNTINTATMKRKQRSIAAHCARNTLEPAQARVGGANLPCMMFYRSNKKLRMGTPNASQVVPTCARPSRITNRRRGRRRSAWPRAAPRLAAPILMQALRVVHVAAEERHHHGRSVPTPTRWWLVNGLTANRAHAVGGNLLCDA